MRASLESNSAKIIKGSTSQKTFDHSKSIERNASKKSIDDGMRTFLCQRPGYNEFHLNLAKASNKEKGDRLRSQRSKETKLTSEQKQQAVVDEIHRMVNQDSFAPKDPFTREKPVFLYKSLFSGRPPTVFFQYPPKINDELKPVYKQHIYKMKDNKFSLKFKVADRVHTYNCVVNSLTFAGFTQTESTNWNVMWSAPLKPETLRNYDMYKHCNHFPGTWQLGRKDLMYRNIASCIREHGDDYNIVPKTWILPYDIGIFRKEREESEGKKLWILKPAASSCGRGIKILSKHSSVPKKGPYVVS